MKHRSAHSHGQTTLAELNITPLLDLVFVLLVIFIITTPQMMNNLEMTLPSGKTTAETGSKPNRKSSASPLMALARLRSTMNCSRYRR